MLSAVCKNRSKISLALGTSPISLPQSSTRRFVVIIVLRTSWRRIMISNRYSPLRFGNGFIPLSSLISRSGLSYRASTFSSPSIVSTVGSCLVTSYRQRVAQAVHCREHGDDWRSVICRLQAAIERLPVTTYRGVTTARAITEKDRKRFLSTFAPKAVNVCLCEAIPVSSSEARFSLDVAISQRVTQPGPRRWTLEALPSRRRPSAPDISRRCTAIRGPASHYTTRSTTGSSKLGADL